MQWLNPAGILGLWSLLAITALYLLRRKSRDVQVPSLLLFRFAENEQLAARPFQKLKKNLLYFLQMVLALLLVLALLRPAVGSGVQGETVLIFDLSLSMQAEENGATRIDAAKRKAAALLEGMQAGDRVTVLAAGEKMESRLSRSADLYHARSVIDELQAGNGGADVDAAVSLAQAMARDIAGLNIIVFSDTYENDGMQIVRAGQGADNRALLSVSASPEGEAFVRIANYGAAADVTIELYADDVLCDMAGLALEAGETRGVKMNAPAGFAVLRAAIAENDALMTDNERFFVLPGDENYRVALAGDNVFIEKAAALREDLTILRTTAADVGALEDIDLYIFDGEMPEKLPENGAILAVDPHLPVDGIACGERKQAQGILRPAYSERAQVISAHLLLENVAIRAYTPLDGGESVLRWSGDSVLAVTESQGRRAAVIGFDLHDSNLPVQGDFPVLMQNLLAYLLPELREELSDLTCGDSVQLPLDARARRVTVTLPGGKTVEAGESFDQTQAQGVYTLERDYGDSARTVRFTAHADTRESDVRQVGASGSAAVAVQAQTASGREITMWLLLAFMALLLVEWGGSRRVG